MRIVTRVDTAERVKDGAQGEVITVDSRFSAFGCTVEIEFSAEFEPAQFATYVFEIDGDVQKEHLRDTIRERLYTIGANGMGTSIVGGNLTIRLIGQTFPPERVAAALGPGGYVELLLRRCTINDCTAGEGYVDTPTGVNSSHMLRASPTRFPLSPTSPIGISLSDDGAALLNDLTNELPPCSGTTLVLSVDDVLLLSSPVEIGGRTPQLRMTGDFTTAQEVEVWAAVIGGGSLDVGLALVDYIPPRAPHQKQTGMRLPTPTPTR